MNAQRCTRARSAVQANARSSTTTATVADSTHPAKFEAGTP